MEDMVINNYLVNLSKKEFDDVQNILRGKSKTLYFSKALDEIYDSNHKIDSFKSSTLKSILEYIELLIPEGYRDNFYRNLKTLEIDYGVEYVSLEKDKKDKKNKGILTLGGYSVVENKIVIYKHTLDDKRAYANTTDNPDETYNKEINRILFRDKNNK